MKNTILSLLFAAATALAGVIPVPAGGNLQTAINAALPGDTIVLDDGASYIGNFTLPEKTGADYITITSATVSEAPGERIRRSSFPRLAKILTPNFEPAVRTLVRAHHYKFLGVEIGTAPGIETWTVILLGAVETTLPDVPSFFEFDRVYVHGDPVKGTTRCIALNTRVTTIQNSYVTDCKHLKNDSQAIAGWNGPGPYKIVNNYLEAAGENIIFGGAVAKIPDVLPSDIYIARNHLYKPLSWKIGHPLYAGTPWAVKNHFELKFARRVIVEDNVLENCWQHFQTGFSVLFTVRTENASVPWAVVEDVLFQRNVIKNAGGGFSLLGKDDAGLGKGLGVTRRIHINGNLVYGISNARFGGGGRLIQIAGGVNRLSVTKNTFIGQNVVLIATGAPSEDFIFTDNIASHGPYGFVGDGVNNGIPVLQKFVPGATFADNVFLDAPTSFRPPDNYFATLATVGFFSPAMEDYRLFESPYTLCGADAAALQRNIK